MDNIITAFILITLLLFVGLSLFQSILEAQDNYQVSWQVMEARITDQAHTVITPVNAEVKNLGQAVELTFKNDGVTKLLDFAEWDLIIHHYSAGTTYHIDSYSYVDSEPLNGQWTVAGVYLDAFSLEPEAYEPDILNPGEEILIRLRLDPPVDSGTANLAILATENGVVVPIEFSY